MSVERRELDIEDQEVYVWAAVDVESFEVLHIEVSPGRSSLDALLFLKGRLREVVSNLYSTAIRGEGHGFG